MNKRQFLKRSLLAAGAISLTSIKDNPLLKAATATSSATRLNNRHQPPKVNKREMVLATLDQSKPNCYVPAAFFMHFHEKTGKPAVDRHAEFFAATNMDIVKVQYEITLPKMEINSPEDWAKVPVQSRDFFEPQIAVIRDLAKKLKNEALIIPTVYSHYSLASQVTDIEKFKHHAQQNPDAVEKGVKRMVDSTINYVQAAVEAGADGFYIATQGGEASVFAESELFDRLILPYDLQVIEACNHNTLLSILHICDYFGAYNRIDKFAACRVSIVNTPYRLANGDVLETAGVQQTFHKPVMGGLDRNGIIATGNEQEILKEVDTVLKKAAPNFILAADCTVPARVDWKTLRRTIDYAHRWREEN